MVFDATGIGDMVEHVDGLGEQFGIDGCPVGTEVQELWRFNQIGHLRVPIYALSLFGTRERNQGPLRLGDWW